MTKKSSPEADTNPTASPPSGPVDRVAVAVKHPGVFMETEDLEKEIGQKLEKGVDPEQIEVHSHEPDESDPTATESQTPEKKPDTPGEEIEIAEQTASVTTRRSVSTRRSRPLPPEESRPAPLKPPMAVEDPTEAEPPWPDLAAGTAEAEEEHSEEESLSSELREDAESIASGSTLTTRSSSRRQGGGVTGGGSLAKKAKLKAAQKTKAALNGKGKSRRYIFKKSAIRAASSVARAMTSDRVFYKGQCFTTGDIVAVTDIEGGIFYGQIRGFLTDQYCEKSGVLSWLLPTLHSPQPDEGFDASTYVIGPEEELPRKLDCFTFVMHAPDDYFFYRNAPYATRSVKPDQEYLMTRAGPKVRLINAGGKVAYRDLDLYD